MVHSFSLEHVNHMTAYRRRSFRVRENLQLLFLQRPPATFVLEAVRKVWRFDRLSPSLSACAAQVMMSLATSSHWLFGSTKPVDTLKAAGADASGLRCRLQRIWQACGAASTI